MPAVHIEVDEVLSLGVEEEFLLVDARTRTAVPRAADVVDKVRPVLDDRVQFEFYGTQVEFSTGPRMTADALRADLAQGRQLGAEAAASTGSLLVAAGSAVLTGHPVPITSDPRYAEMAARFDGAVRAVGAEPSACHVHLGTLDRSEALALGNHLRPWLPTLQALCVNSPYAAGADRGCSSWRHFDYQAWPTVGPAPVLDEAGYERHIRSLLAAGTIMDRRMVYWYARPSEHCPTLELRVADANADLDVVLLYALLARGLGTTLLAEIRAGVPCPEVDRSVLVRAHDAVACTGLSGSTFDPTLGAFAPTKSVLAGLVERSRPGLEAAGDQAAVLRLLDELESRGTGAHRQREAYQYRGSLADVVDAVAVRPREGSCAASSA